MSRATMQEQLPLQVTLRDEAHFGNYHGDHNRTAVARLQQFLRGSGGVAMVCGASGAGKSHLLNAACIDAESRGDSAICLALTEAVHLPPDALQGLETFSLICLDDLQALPAEAAWEEALFHLHNRALDAGHHLLLSAPDTPAVMEWELPDLASRLRAALVIQLVSPRDEDRLALLQARAECRGLMLGDDLARYIMRRAPRDTGSLLALLARLDDASLRNQRRLTIPFVKSVMDW